LPEADFLAWGWRVALRLSAVPVFVGILIRAPVMETPEFTRGRAAKQQASARFAEMITKYPKNVLPRMGARYI